MSSKVKEKLKKRELVSYVYVMYPVDFRASPETAMALGRIEGLDILMLDMQHRATTFDQVRLYREALIRVQSDVNLMVRLATGSTDGSPEISRFTVSRVLDVGACGIMVADVDTKEETQAIVDASYYPPKGQRSASDVGTPEVSDRNNECIVVIPEIETPMGVKNADEIAAVDGVDGLMIGPFDLSYTLGVPCQWKSDTFMNACEKVANACKKHNKSFGFLAARAVGSERERELDCNILSLGSPWLHITRGGAEALQQVKKARASIENII